MGRARRLQGLAQIACPAARLQCLGRRTSAAEQPGELSLRATSTTITRWCLPPFCGILDARGAFVEEFLGSGLKRAGKWYRYQGSDQSEYGSTAEHGY